MNTFRHYIFLADPNAGQLGWRHLCPNEVGKRASRLRDHEV